MQLKRATRKQSKLRIGLSAASGFGKTYGALLLAFGITGDWSKIALIDSENGSGDLYSNLGEYNTLGLTAPYSPERYIEAIKMCEDAGMEVIIVDSITHEWDGPGGCLEIQEKLGGRYQDWAKVGPRHQAFINAILQSKAHVITTVRRKQDYAMGKDSNGRNTVEKAGTKEVTRDGFEYELTVNLEITNKQHLATASKDRTMLFAGKPEFIIGVETGQLLKKWADEGIDPVKDAVKAIDEAKDGATVRSIIDSAGSVAEHPEFKAAVERARERLTPKKPEPVAEEAEPVSPPSEDSGAAGGNGEVSLKEAVVALQKDNVAEPQHPGTAISDDEKQVEPDRAYTSASQKEEIIRLLNHPVITRPEKTKMLLNINKLNEEKADETIAKLKKAISDRENSEAA